MNLTYNFLMGMHTGFPWFPWGHGLMALLSVILILILLAGRTDRLGGRAASEARGLWESRWTVPGRRAGTTHPSVTM